MVLCLLRKTVAVCSYESNILGGGCCGVKAVSRFGGTRYGGEAGSRWRAEKETESQITVDLKKSGSEFGTGGCLLFYSTS